MALDDLVSDFVAETREGLEALDSELVRFEQQPEDPATLGGIFRLVHTIKGTCGFLGLARLQKVAHAAENVLGGFRDRVLPVTPAAVSAILEAVDLIRLLVDEVATTGGEPAGDDAELIARLDALFESAAKEGPRASPPPDAAATPAEGGDLIERLGGEATLDAAAEAVIARLARSAEFGAQLGRLDQDDLQGAVREALCETARNGAFAARLYQLRGEIPGALGVMTAMLGEALAELDVGASAIRDLQALVLASEASAADASENPPPSGPWASPSAASMTNGPSFAVPANPQAASTEGVAAQTIRVSVEALEHLMTVVSELVLIRNQLIQTLRLEPESPFAAPLHRLNQVTSELQEGVMTTRMQPISGAWAKLPRLVRDLSQDLDKRIDLQMSGQETELDRQVLELIRDPLTHMIRNAADHGLETAEERRATGKSETGRITLQARHEGGAIVIEVADDGRGLAADRIRAKAVATGLLPASQAEQMSDAEARQLIFLPGFSTASQVTSVSGRGVGMDVVRTNIEKIGGTIEMTSVEGGGTRFSIRIPLTLTIVSALIVECCGERFALPQSSLVELVSASGASGHAIEQINGTPVLRLRDRLLPLISLQQLLALRPSAEPSGETCIVVAQVGAFAFGVIVDRVFDTEEIVVKPVATVLRHLKLYSGATILGDGSVILILDPKGISLELGSQTSAPQDDPRASGATAARSEVEALLVFRAANDALKAAPLAAVSRIEEVGSEEIERVDGRAVIQYRGRLMPIMGVDARPAPSWEGGARRPLLVFAQEDRAVGLLVDEIVDIVDSSAAAELNANGEGALGSLIVAGRATELVDVSFYWRQAMNDDAPRVRSATVAEPSARARRLLVIDPSAFSQLLLQPLLAKAGYEVVVAATPAAAVARHNAGEHFHLILADTGRGPEDVEAFARALAQAKGWHGTPLVTLSISGEDSGAPLDGPALLAEVSSALANVRGVA